MRTAILALLLPIAVSAFFFGNSCGCQQRCPTPVCAPPQAPVCPPPPVCGGGGAYAAPPQQFQPQPVYRGQPQCTFGFHLPPLIVVHAPPLQQVQPQPQQYYQQLPAGGYAVSQQAQPAEFGDEALAAQSENHEFPTNGQSATLETEESPSVAAPSEQSSVASDTTPVDDGAEIVDTNEAAPQTTAAQYSTGGSQTKDEVVENTVYDDIVNAAQSATPTVEYSAAASSRRRYHSIRRAPAAAFDPKCNSETLKTLIHENIGDSTSSSKRAIQKAASEEIGGHVDVICSTGTFSYIVNTELYCETEKDGITCFAFRQSN